MKFLPRKFSLRTLLCFTAIVLCGVGYFSNAARAFNAEQSLLRELEKAQKLDRIYYLDGHPSGNTMLGDYG